MLRALLATAPIFVVGTLLVVAVFLGLRHGEFAWRGVVRRPENPIAFFFSIILFGALGIFLIFFAAYLLVTWPFERFH
jgi:hypothetical protein